MAAAHPIFTIGHSTRSFDAFLALLAAAGVTLLVDVRAFPMSRRHPQFNRDTLEQDLPRAGIAYQHMAALGGRRKKQPDIDRAVNGAWKNESFHNYADYALTPPFREALAALCRLADSQTPAICCAEAHWSNCHRRIITDHLLARGESVFHILDAGRREPALIYPAAQIRPDGAVIYPPEQPSLFA